MAGSSEKSAARAGKKMASNPEKKTASNPEKKTTPKTEKSAPKTEKKKASKSAAVEAGDFPRGGSNGLTPLEFREVSRQAEREALFSDGVTGGSAGKKKRRVADDDGETKTQKKTKKKTGATADDSADVDDGSLLDEDRLCPVEVLSFKRLTKGALVLGCISAIRDLELLVSLPNGLVGVVPITSISAELTALVEKAAANAEESGQSSDEDAMDVDESGPSSDDPLDLKLRFFIGQYVKCVISELGDGQPADGAKTQKKSKSFSRIELTLAPEEVNDRFDNEDLCEGLVMTASVKSIEDRGYVLNTGVSADRLAAFLPTEEAQAWLERWMPHAAELRVGQLVEAAVSKVSDDRRSLRLTINPAVVAHATAKDTFKTMASVQPGQLVPATVLKVWDRGLSLRFMGFYDCSANLSGLGLASARDSTDIKKKYDLGDIVNVRVLYVSLTTASKTVIVATLPHVLALQPRPALTGYELPSAARLATGKAATSSTASESAPSAASAKRAPADAGQWPIPYGTVLEDCVVVGLVGNKGVVLSISGVKSVHAFATAANLVEEGVDAPQLQKHAGPFHIGSRHRARVVGYDAIDATVRVSLRPSVVDQKFLTISDVLPGMVVSGTVKCLKESGAEIIISPSVQGFVHKQHLSDAQLKHPELQFKPGKQVSCRVFKVLYEKGSVLLTCRKSLAQSKLPIVTGYTEAEGAVPGAITMAVVERAVSGGTIVGFYQGARGYIASTGASKQLEPGQTLKCRVLSADQGKHRIWASLNIDPDVSMSEVLEEAKPVRRAAYSTDVSQVSVGDIVSGVVAKVAEPYITLRLNGSDLCASISFGHLSDYKGALLDKAIARVKPGVVLSDLVVVSVTEKGSRVVVSAKPALVKAARAGCIASSMSEVTKGKTLVGWITGTTNFGAFVSFPGSITALASLDMLADRFVSSPADLFYADQTVVASVVSVEDSQEGKRIRVSLKGSVADVAASGCLGHSDFLLEYFDELEGSAGSELLNQIGAQTLVTVKQKHPYGLVVSPLGCNDALLSTSSGFITIDQAKDRFDECKEDAEVAACVLDVDPEKGIVDYSLRHALVPVATSLEAAGKGSKAADKKKAGAALRKAQADHADKTASWDKSLKAACDKKSLTQLVVEVVKEDYLVLSLPLHGNAIAFAMTKSYNDRSKPFMRFKVGQRLNGTPVRVETNRRTLVLLQQSAYDAVGSSNSSADAKEGVKRATVRPVDPAVNFFEDYVPGLTTVAKVMSIKGVQANLDLAANVKGRLHITELLDDVSGIVAKSSNDVFAAAGVRVGDRIQVKVIGLHDSKVYKFLPITHRASPLKSVIDVTVRPSELAADWASAPADKSHSRVASWKSAKPGDSFKGFVKGVQEGKNKGKTVVLVSLNSSLVGHLPILAATSSFETASHPDRYFVPGRPIEVRVSMVDTKSKEVILAPHGDYISDVELPIASRAQLVPGARVICSVFKTLATAMFTEIELVEPASGTNKAPRTTHVHGSVDAFHAADTLSAKPFAKYSVGQLLEAVVVWVSADAKDEHIKVGLSLRPSVLDPAKFPPSGVADPIIASSADVNVGQVVRGYIKQTSEVGCFVGLGRNVAGRALISELSDEYVREVKTAFPSDKLVSAVVTEVNRELNRISLSLRPSRIGDTTGSDGAAKRRLDQIEVGETLKGTITRIEEYGVFIKPDDSFVTGLCYIREIADSETPVDPKALYEVGDRVLARVLKVDVAKDRLALGLKASYFANASDSESGSDNEDEEMESVEASSDEAEEDASEEDDEAASNDDVDNDEDDDDASAESESDTDESDTSDLAESALPVPSGFQWGDDEVESGNSGNGPTAAIRNADSDSDESSDESSDEEAGNGKGKKGKRSKMERITQDVTAELSEQTPTRTTDFERLIVGSPNSSFVWLQFMAFYLGQSEVEQARTIAERALKTISPREEQEKMNVWVALLNLEHRFGTKETLDGVLKRAIQFMNPKHIYLQMAKIYERADQFVEAENMHKVATSKFSGSCKVWVLFGLFYLKHGKVAESRDLLARALQPLPKRKHIKAITQFGQMEFKHGEPERGRTVFEGVLGTYPKRVDLWSVYLDMEIKVATSSSQDAASALSEHCWDAARKLFERVTSMKHSSKKMKFFFKKWLAFEKAHGTDASIEHVKQRALEYVNSLSS